MGDVIQFYASNENVTALELTPEPANSEVKKKLTWISANKDATPTAYPWNCVIYDVRLSFKNSQSFNHIDRRFKMARAY